MSTTQNKNKPYDLEERTYAFALETRLFLKDKHWDPVSWPDVRQLLRSSGSVAANYVEALESISPDDYLYRIRVCKKEVRESGMWLRLISDCNPIDESIQRELDELVDETKELVKIFVTLIRNKSAQQPLP